ncbi:squamous cell carcinoma antigen recognized by T-cells 3-like isoform X1 [Helicoverpa zea]|uniref:squamous cell carcinoma antigen recognized by T-cells 3-like isoform X1 n=1 Tax=Helicoverpa zea TaxID=7113 RepID=UPI001F55F833|nr:squamous cell carcinoma antigen recognized by T-cells 3-like isoform X1 [Helicoverpa zea]
MAIVEDEVRNESEEENEIEVVVEEEENDGADSDDSDVCTPDEDEDMILERKVKELEARIAEDPYNYDEHVDLIQALWGLSSLERWRSAFERLQQLSSLRAEHWLLRLQTEVSLAHTDVSRERVAKLFQQAALDCYSIPILSEWCSWSLTFGEADKARAQLEEVIRRAGADPFSGKIFWDAKLELEKAQLETMREEDTEYVAQKERVLWCLEEAVSRPLLRGEDALQQMEELALSLHDQDYVDKVKKQHESAADFLNKITPFEDKLLTLENPDEKCQVYQEYIDTVKDLSLDEKYAECDSNGILRVLYDRATTDCVVCAGSYELLVAYARHAHAHSSRSTYSRVLDSCGRRCPRRATFWTLAMQQAEHEGRGFEEVKSIFETALSKGMETYKQNEALWLSYLEYTRRRTQLDNEDDVEKMRRTFRLAWDSLAEAWGEEANDCEVPLYWARLEYKVLNEPKQGKEIFEEIFKYGENKTMSKYWEALITLESNRSPKPSENKLRDLMRRALRSVKDYPPSIARLWTDYERDHGHLSTLRECVDACEAKTKEWRESYQAMKDKMIGNKKQQKGKPDNKKSKFDKKKSKDDFKDKGKGKRKSDGADEGSKGKRKKEVEMEVDQEDTGGVKRSHDDEEEEEVVESKRQRTDSTSPHRLGTRDACTLFVSNLEFKVDEQRLRDKLSQYGDIISLRVRKGIKAFGGSICYCQYKTPEAVDEALKHDRMPLDGRPMFLSRYSAKKSKPTFKYSTEAEKNKLFVKNLPFSHCTKDALADVFDKYGKLKDVRVVTHKDGKPKGLAYIEYEDESSAAAAVTNTHGMTLADRKLDVALSAPPPRHTDLPALGLAKRDAGGGMYVYCSYSNNTHDTPSCLHSASPSETRAVACMYTVVIVTTHTTHRAACTRPRQARRGRWHVCIL